MQDRWKVTGVLTSKEELLIFHKTSEFPIAASRNTRSWRLPSSKPSCRNSCTACFFLSRLNAANFLPTVRKIIFSFITAFSQVVSYTSLKRAPRWSASCLWNWPSPSPQSAQKDRQELAVLPPGVIPLLLLWDMGWMQGDKLVSDQNTHRKISHFKYYMRDISSLLIASSRLISNSIRSWHSEVI